VVLAGAPGVGKYRTVINCKRVQRMEDRGRRYGLKKKRETTKEIKKET
jgi:hypothetical protein